MDSILRRMSPRSWPRRGSSSSGSTRRPTWKVSRPVDNARPVRTSRATTGSCTNTRRAVRRRRSSWLASPRAPASLCWQRPTADEAVIAGVVGLGLPDLNELGWRWRDALIYITHGVPKEPSFSTAAIVKRVAPIALAAIHSTHDEFVPLAEVQESSPARANRRSSGLSTPPTIASATTCPSSDAACWRRSTGSETTKAGEGMTCAPCRARSQLPRSQSIDAENVGSWKACLLFCRSASSPSPPAGSS